MLAKDVIKLTLLSGEAVEIGSDMLQTLLEAYIQEWRDSGEPFTEWFKPCENEFCDLWFPEGEVMGGGNYHEICEACLLNGDE